MGNEDCFDWDAWQRDFDQLPPEVQEPLQEWYLLQGWIIDHLKIEEADWYGYISWALQNPGDTSFIDGVSQGEQSGIEDGRQDEDPEEAKRRQITGEEKDMHAVASGPGIKEKATQGGLDGEIFQRMLLNQMKPRARTKKESPRKKPPRRK